ncbi:MAG: hypothetical protein Q7J32_13240 [Sphingomonadaceae bacterium]|nr:hypothetical protein [Sphingomonadaceae bacterium]
MANMIEFSISGDCHPRWKYRNFEVLKGAGVDHVCFGTDWGNVLRILHAAEAHAAR